MLVYATAREITWKRALALALMTIAACDSKEMGAAIPALALAYDLTIARRLRWLGLFATGFPALLYAGGRVFLKNELSDQSSYQLTLTLHQFLVATQNYLDWLAFRVTMPENNFTSPVPLILLLAALALAIALRSRLMIFGWLYFQFALLPIEFAPTRMGYVLYIPLTGCAIYLAGLVECIKRLPRFVYLPATAALACLIVASQLAEHRALKRRQDGPGGTEEVRNLADDVSRRYPSLPRGARILLVNDAFGPDDRWHPVFTLGLRYHDLSLVTEKTAWDRKTFPVPLPPGRFDHVFLCFDGRYTELPANRSLVPSFTEMGAQDSHWNIVSGLDGPAPDGVRWAHQDFELQFAAPEGAARFAMDYTAPGVIIRQTGPPKVHCWIAGEAVEPPQISKEGDYRFEAPLPKNAPPGQLVSVKFHVDNPYVGADGARFTFLVRRAGLIQNGRTL
jgi:hypothetical protein